MAEEHRAANAVTAEVADEAKQVAEEAREVAQDAQSAAHVALEQSASVAAAPAVEVAPVAAEEDVAHDRTDEVLDRLSGISARLDDHETRFASLTAPKEEEPASDVIEVETEPEPAEKSKPASKPTAKKTTDNTGKEGEQHVSTDGEAKGRRGFRRGRS